MSLPISLDQARHVATWMKVNFGAALTAASAGTPFTPDLLCAIVCQETAYFWLPFQDQLTPAELLGRCVLDASGDAAGTSRHVFPRHTAEFRARYGDAKTELLIGEANLTRAVRGMGPKPWVYKGYGLFQYDLQYVANDPDFFFERRWYQLDACLQRVLGELTGKYAATHDLWLAVQAYNGSGPAAVAYAANVRAFHATISGH